MALLYFRAVLVGDPLLAGAARLKHRGADLDPSASPWRNPRQPGHGRSVFTYTERGASLNDAVHSTGGLRYLITKPPPKLPHLPQAHSAKADAFTVLKTADRQVPRRHRSFAAGRKDRLNTAHPN